MFISIVMKFCSTNLFPLHYNLYLSPGCPMERTKKRLFPNGIRFQCQRSGKCCRSRGSYSYIYFSLKDRQRLAKHLNLPTRSITRRFMKKTDGLFHLKQPDKRCPFLTASGCSIYEARPTQCRTWPFWPENMKRKVWEEEIAPLCEGIGKGRLYSPEEVTSLIRLNRD